MVAVSVSGGADLVAELPQPSAMKRAATNMASARGRKPFRPGFRRLALVLDPVMQPPSRFRRGHHYFSRTDHHETGQVFSSYDTKLRGQPIYCTGAARAEIAGGDLTKESARSAR